MLRKKFKDLNDIMENNTYIEFYIKKWFNFKKNNNGKYGIKYVQNC